MAKTAEETLATARAYKKVHAEKIKEMRRAHYLKNKEKELAMAKEWRKDNVEILKVTKQVADKKYRENNPDKIKAHWLKSKDRTNERRRVRYATIPTFNSRMRLSNLFRYALRHYLNKGSKCSISDLIGCTIEEFVQHMEAKFTDGMTWQNIHIDHKKPCALFDLTLLEEQKKCFHYTNLQPLFGLDNISKGAKYIEDATA